MRDKHSADSDWRQLCQIALLELDPVKTIERIAEARNAVLNRIEDGFTKSHDKEQVLLREALSSLDSLRKITESQNHYQANLRKITEGENRYQASLRKLTEGQNRYPAKAT